MRFINNLPLRHKLLYGVLANCLVALLLACAGLFWFQTLQLRKSFGDRLESLGTILANHSTAPLAFNDRKSALEVLDALESMRNILYARILDAEGSVFVTVGTYHGIASGRKLRADGRVQFDDGFGRVVTLIKLEDGKYGRLELCAGFQEEFEKLISLYAAAAALVLAGALLLILLMSSVLQRIITGPILALSDVAHRITSQEDYSVRAREVGLDEVGLLTRTFNRMLDQIQSRDRRLRESQRDAIAVMGSTDGLWDWDLAAEVVYFSPRWKGMLGYMDHELENSRETLRQLLHPDDAAAVFAEIERYLESGAGGYEAEYRMRHKNGSHRWILARGAALRDHTGKPFRFAGSHTDISERKVAEDALRLSREKFETLVNSIDGIVWEADPRTLAYSFVSRQAERILGFPVERWLESPNFWMGQIHEEDRAEVRQRFATAIERRSTVKCEFRMRSADGQEVWVRDVISLSQESGGQAVLRGLLFDISEQKRAEKDLELLNRRLRDASREAGMAEVATGVLHNVGNVLNSVNVSATLVVEQMRKSKTASLARAVQLLRSRQADLAEFLTRDPQGLQLPGFLEALSEHLVAEQMKLIKEMKSLQRNIEHIKHIVATQQHYAKVGGALENLNLQDLVEDALRMSTESLARHQIEVVRRFEPTPPALLDRHKVLQILVNLLSNAKHALRDRTEGRRLELRLSRLDTNFVRFEVTDNGSGIAPDNLTRVFQHGFTTKKSGHGFGLHSGANAAVEMGGRLTVHSDGLGHGASFRLDLPVSVHTAQAIIGPADTQADQPLRPAA